MMGKNRVRRSRDMDMLHGSLADKLLFFAMPLAASSILQQLFNSADVAVVGRFAGSQALAAVGSNGSVISLLVNLFVGLSVGANVVIANYIGQQHREKIQDVVHTVMVLTIVSGLFLMALGVVIARPLLTLMETPEDVIELAVLYLRIYFLGMPFIMMYNFGSAILRSKGDTRRPLYCLILSGVINVILNLVLVIVFRLSVAGVAIATMISNAVSSGLILYILTHEDEMIRVHLDQLRVNRRDLMQIIRIGAPAGLQGVVFSISNVCIQAAINGFGSAAVAGASAAQNFEFFIYYMTSAFSQAVVTFTSQNYGARQYDRCKKVFRISMLYSLVITAAMSAVFVFWRSRVILVYTTEQAVIDFAMIRMVHAVSLECLNCTYEIGGAALRGMGYSMLPAVFTVIGSCAFRLVWLSTVFRIVGTYGILMDVYPVTWAITGAMVLTAYFVIRRRLFAEGGKAQLV